MSVTGIRRAGSAIAGAVGLLPLRAPRAGVPSAPGRSLVEEGSTTSDPAGPADVPAPAWPVAQRVGFRLLATYFALYVFAFQGPLIVVPVIGGYAAQGARWLWEAAAVWVATHVLRLDGELFLGPTGSGDTTFDYVKLLIIAVLAPLGAAIWTLLDRRRLHYASASRWLIVGCRYYLALTMLVYGIAKVIPMQFPSPGLVRLLTPYGDSSPMGLLWTFMGASTAYSMFAGACEVLGGALLLFRRTLTLGAAIVVAVMSNVVMLNFTYDVPVKQATSAGSPAACCCTAPGEAPESRSVCASAISRRWS